MNVLDEIQKLDVLSNGVEYCMDVDPTGLNIYITNPQAGITYDLVQASDDTKVGSSITFNGTNIIEWTDLTGTETYYVMGYYSSVPSTRVEMLNRVTITRNNFV